MLLFKTKTGVLKTTTYPKQAMLIQKRVEWANPVTFQQGFALFQEAELFSKVVPLRNRNPLP